jgi:hypothetical protein
MRCTYCHRQYTRTEFDELDLVKKNGGCVTFAGEVHEYRVCTCGSHVLLVTVRRASSRPSFQPSPAFSEANDGRRR